MSDSQKNKDKPSILAVIGVIAAIIPLFSLAFSAYQFIKLEDARFKQQTFENYHATISKIATENRDATVVSAAIYELKNYPEYCQISLSIIDHYYEQWTNDLSRKAMALAKSDLQKVCKE